MMINPSQDEHLIIEISTAKANYYKDVENIKLLLSKDSFSTFYTDGKCCKQNGCDITGYNFIFLDDKLDIEAKLEAIFTANQNSKFRIAIHKTTKANPELTILRLNVKYQGLEIKYKLFSHENDDIWTKGLNPLIESIDRNQSDYDRCFKTLCNLIYSPLNEAKALRARLLTPLVVLDLISQMPAKHKENSETRQLAKRARTAIDDDVIKNDKFLVEWQREDLSLPPIPAEIATQNNNHCNELAHDKLKDFAKAIESSLQEIQREGR